MKEYLGSFSEFSLINDTYLWTNVINKYDEQVLLQVIDELGYGDA
jgi:hypothetical protein